MARITQSAGNTRRWLRARPFAERDRARASLIDVTLDPAQRGAVELPAGRSLLVLGEAGHGKTTVALHRLAYLWKLAHATKRTGRAPPRAAVLVPTEGLERLLQPLLRKLGVDIEVTVYERWAAAQAGRAFRDLPRKESEDATPGVLRLKRAGAIRVALEELAARAPGRIDDDPDAREDVPRASRAHARRADLQQLFGDRVLLERVAATARERVTKLMIKDTLEHTRIQFTRTTERLYAHVDDRRRLVAVDGLSLDSGTVTGDAWSIDSEDYAVLFELDRMRAERRGLAPTQPRPHDFILVDEAQELAPLELALVGRSLAPGGTLIVAGDAEQQIDPSVTFDGWQETMRELGSIEYVTATLQIGYRCPPGVVAIARHLIGAAEPAAEAHKPRPRDALSISFADEAELARWLVDELRSLLTRDRGISVAVVCRTPVEARRVTRWFRGGSPVRLVLDGSFLPRGVQVTSVDQVKGLEFDVVVVPDAGASSYPDEPSSRRALYVAVTRARRQLVLAYTGGHVESSRHDR